MRDRTGRIGKETIKPSRHITAWVPAVAGVLVLAATATACGGGSDKPAEAATTTPAGPAPAATTSAPPPAPTADPTVKAGTDVLAAYKAFTDYKVTALRSGHADVNKQSAVAMGDAYKSLASTIFESQQSGVVFKGDLVSAPAVEAIDLTASPGKATLTDCLDVSHWEPVYSSNGKSAAAPSQATRFVVNVGAQQMPDGTWRISQYTTDKARSC
ncbi:hypothetical protein ACFV0O_34490 [Kitasatospora sp. NPDC059577]|uniref:hypothetical protein n=1 Tax=unclassified Kitasatospora TaxID=2633591 RepID=UPI0036977ACC